MERLRTLDPSRATGKTKQLFDDIQNRLGMIPNFMRTLANSPAALETYITVTNSLENGILPTKLREQIALVVAELNRSEYCLAAHSIIGRTVGLSEEEVLDSRRGVSPDSKVEAALWFAHQVVEKRGRVTRKDVYRLTRVGYGEGEIAEIVANIALNIFINYFNLVAGALLDFPKAPELK
jgi:uncharacterized peroxidase-related enzyme